jgi:hypothetical protein
LQEIRVSPAPGILPILIQAIDRHKIINSMKKAAGEDWQEGAGLARQTENRMI